MTIEIDPQTDKNRDDISKLTANVAALTEIVRAQGIRQDDALTTIKDAVTKISSLDEKVSIMSALNAKIAEMDKSLSGLRHDVNNTVMPAQNYLPVIKEEVTTLKTQMTEIAKWKTENAAPIASALSKVTEIIAWKERVTGGVGAIEKSGHLVWKILAIAGPIMAFILAHYIHFGPVTISGE